MDEHAYDSFRHKEHPPIPSDHVNGSYFKKNWKKGGHNEVLFPGKHVSHLPWKSFQWEENDIPADKELKDFQNVSITVKSLSHVTHNKEFGQICAIDRNAYTLLPNQKKGKSGYETTDSSPLGYSFVGDKDQSPDEEASYRYIKPDECILPGRYIWWSVEVDSRELPPYPDGYSVSNAISNHKSLYGNNKIRGYIKYVLEAYQSSFPRNPSNGKLPRIEFRIGGTLRYRFEVCHVVIVCRENEEQLPLDEYPLWEEGKDKIQYHYDTSEVKWVNRIQITINNGISGKKDERYSWDHIVFGLYFPGDNQMSLACPKNLFEVKNVQHGRPCLKSKLVSRKRRICPNLDPNINVKKRAQKRRGQPLEEEPPLKK